MTAKWDVEYTDELAEWWAKLTELEQVSIDTSVRLLEEKGPNLGFPHTSSIAGSRHAHMRELRVQHAGRPYRILYAFDPRRCAILLLGGDKTGNNRWYEKNIPIADALYDIHIGTLGKERRINGKKIQ